MFKVLLIGAEVSLSILALETSVRAEDFVSKVSTPEKIGAAYMAIKWAYPRCTQLDYNTDNIAIVRKMFLSASAVSPDRVQRGAADAYTALLSDWKALGPAAACLKLGLAEPALFSLKAD